MTNIDDVSIDASIAESKEKQLFCAHCRTTLLLMNMKQCSQVHQRKITHVVYAERKTWNDCGVDIIAPDTKLLQKDAVKENLWFYVTTKQNWIEDVNASGSEDISDLPVIHVGSKEAALDRLAYLSANNKNQKWYLYAVKVNPAVPVANTVHGNEYNFPTTYSRASNESEKRLRRDRSNMLVEPLRSTRNRKPHGKPFSY